MAYTDEQIRDRAVGSRAALATYYGAVGAALTDAAEVDIEWARSQVAEAVFNTKTLLALGLLLAHLGTLRQVAAQNGTGAPAVIVGPVTSTTVGGMSIARGSGGVIGAWTPQDAEDAFLMQTTDGASFVALRNTRARTRPPRVH